MIIYFIQKEGVYFQGVYWVGESLSEAEKTAIVLATHDNDDYHEWCIYKYNANFDNKKLSVCKKGDSEVRVEK